MRATKIVATLGPAVDSYESIVRLIQAGMNVARLNFSHGDHAEHARRIELVRRAAAELGQPVAILQDLAGPKMRTGEHLHDEPLVLKAGQQFTLTTDDVLGTSERVSTTYKALPQDVHPADRILLSDGRIALEVLEKTATEVICRVCNGGVLRPKQGINLPGVNISAPSVTRKDIADLEFGLAHDVDYVAISFVRRAGDVEQVKKLIAGAGRNVPVIAKIERPEALAVLNDILDVADGVMVARGDLGVEIPLEQVPLIQKHIIAAANRRAVPVITATQMLESMINDPSPTRAEVSDIANAILDGSDAVMLSGETSIGQYPVEAVQTMAAIAAAVETSGTLPPHSHTDSTDWVLHEVQTIPQAIGTAVSAITKALAVNAIWVFTQSGRTARQVSHYRPAVPIIALTPYDHIYRRLALLWGVQPLKSDYYEDDLEFWQQIIPTVIQSGYARPGDTVVITGGHPFNQHGPTNFLKIMQIGQE
ncbi:MAG: pyruvate kinase [Anaerolineae bacterium]|nr:pyruvate kinase [Anaerolineae bacterium]